ncbi:MAG: FAD-dependent oxidoreductase [Planctomycetota bacterium]|nr:FAD-dependent oxidoreductase [Planctomycetota bacterium]
MKTIAVVGAGISGLAAASLLSRRHRVHLFEREGRLGGHTNTVSIDGPDGTVPLDTGFLVHNARTYPNLVRLFGELGVTTRDSDMSFAVSCRRTGLEYSSRGANGFFAQRRNVVRPEHLFLLREIVRFNRQAPTLLDAPDADRQTLGDFLDSRGFGETFTHRYLLPMASAIWSASLNAIRSFPALTLIRFFDNHGLLSLTAQPTWKVVSGGSDLYIPHLVALVSGGVHPGAAIHAVRRRYENGVEITFRDRPSMTFDEVVFACHGDQVLPLLADATVRERDVFTNFVTTANLAWLHTDASVLPAQTRARASWNYRLAADTDAAPTVTYDLNRLQGLTTSEQYCVTLNPDGGIDERRVLRRLVYRHPLYTREAISAQRQWCDVSGVNRTHYCGAYWAHGFHEDGLNSALRVARALGVDW